MNLNSENVVPGEPFFELNDIYNILGMTEEHEYTSDTLGGVAYHSFNVLYGTYVPYGEETVFVEAGFHQLTMNAYTNEWLDYYPPTEKGNSNA